MLSLSVLPFIERLYNTVLYPAQPRKSLAWEDDVCRGWCLPAICQAEPSSDHVQPDTSVPLTQEWRVEHLSQMTVPPALLLIGSFCRGYVSVGELSDGELVCSSLLVQMLVVIHPYMLLPQSWEFFRSSDG